MNEIKKESLITYCQGNGRVCPMPQPWNQLWEMLPERQRVGNGWEPPLPLILGAWGFSSNLEKQMRLMDHIDWAEHHGNLTQVDAFLRGLAESDWHHFGD